MEERTNLQKIVLVALAAMILLFGVLTGISKAHKGVFFDGALLERTVVPDQTTYTGKVHGEAVTVTVRNDGGSVTTVEYVVGEALHDVYTMEYPLDPIQTEYGAVDGIRILKNGKVLFEGGYTTDHTYGWYDTNGEWDPGIGGAVGYGPAGAPMELGRGDVVGFARGPELVSRGSWALYAMLVLLTLLLAFDVAYPTALFYIQHCCDVRDPEPSDFYLTMQKIGWVVYPFVLLGANVWALRQFP